MNHKFIHLWAPIPVLPKNSTNKSSKRASIYIGTETFRQIQMGVMAIINIASKPIENLWIWADAHGSKLPPATDISITKPEKAAPIINTIKPQLINKTFLHPVGTVLTRYSR